MILKKLTSSNGKWREITGWAKGVILISPWDTLNINWINDFQSI